MIEEKKKQPFSLWHLDTYSIFMIILGICFFVIMCVSVICVTLIAIVNLISFTIKLL